MEYLTHYNGARPLKVVVDGDLVTIYDEDEDELISTRVQRVFVGKSPENAMTRYSDAYGPEFDGNTILMENRDLDYTFVCERMLRFASLYPIRTFRTFVSPVGNNDVPYPYAIDTEGYYYLLIENVVFRPEEDLDDPYAYYYNRSLMTTDEGCIPPRRPTLDSGVRSWFISHIRYTMRYDPFPEKEYERFMAWGEGSMTYIDASGNTHDMPKETYVKLVREFGEKAGFIPLTILPPDLVAYGFTEAEAKQAEQDYKDFLAKEQAAVAQNAAEPASSL